MTVSRLYKYRSIDSDTLSMFVNREFYFSDPARFNDPYDCQINIGHGLQEAINSAPATTKIALSKYVALNELYEKIERDVKKTGVLCFSKACNNVLMWSHYASEHRGICIGFKLSDHFTKLNDAQKIFGAENVRYFKNTPFIEFFHEIAHLPALMPFDDFWIKLFTVGLLSKSTAWKYEKEVRVIRAEPGCVPFSQKELVEIVFGLHIEKKNEKTIRSLLSGEEWKHVKFKRVVRVGSGYSLKLVGA